MPLSFKQLRTAISDQIGTLTGFRLIKLPPAQFGRSQQTIAHLGYTVGLQSSEQINERQRSYSGGYYVQTNITVIFGYRLRPTEIYPTDYDNSLEQEQEVIIKVLSSYQAIRNEVQLRFISSQRTIAESSEYMIITLNFQAFHTIT